jgi:hypothetical protein
MFNRTKAVIPPIMIKTKSATMSARSRNAKTIIVFMNLAPSTQARGREDRANLAGSLDQPTWCTRRRQMRWNQMDPPLRQTIKNRLTYVNLTDTLQTNFVIDRKGVLRKRYALRWNDTRGRSLREQGARNHSHLSTLSNAGF